MMRGPGRVLLSLAAAEGVRGQFCPPPSPPEEQTGGADCPAETPIYYGQKVFNGTHIELIPGCPVKTFVAKDEHIYFKLNRTKPGLRLKHKWAYADATTLISLYGFNDEQPFYSGGPSAYGASYEWYGWPASAADELVYYEDKVDRKDQYHCASAFCGSYCGDGALESNYVDCVGLPWVEENTGWTYISLSGWFNSDGQVVESTHTWDYLTPGYNIRSDQLAAVKDMWTGMCWPTQQSIPVFPDEGSSSKPHWNQDDHAEGKYSVLSLWEYKDMFNTTGGERDSDYTPFCDWLYGVDVAALTTNDCENIDYIFCDDEGNVVEMQLSGRALKGDLPASFTAFTKLEKLYLGSNQITGPLPYTIWTSPHLETLSISKNFFTGEIICPTHDEPKLKAVYLSQNDFSGPFPACIFAKAPKLQYLALNYLKLSDAHIPQEIKYATELVSFSAVHTGLTGTLPVELKCMSKLSFLSVQRNHLSGEIDQEMFDGMTSIYSLDLSDNMFTGPVPHVGTTHTGLRNMYLNDNKFSGEMEMQLKEFADSQEQGAAANVAFGDNSLSGPLPDVYYNLVMNAKRISGLSVAGNHYRCGPDGDWPDWVYRMGSAFFGKCVPVAKPVRAVNVVPGEFMSIYGENFAPSEELKCKVGSEASSAEWVSSTMIRCLTPTQLPLAEPFPLKVANYGEDFSGMDTITSFTDPMVTLVPFASDDEDIGTDSVADIPSGMKATDKADAVCPPSAPPAEEEAAGANCPTVTPVYYGANGLPDPIELIPGCPIKTVIAQDEHVYFKINRTKPGLRLFYKWLYAGSTTQLALYGFNNEAPFYSGSYGAYYEWYYKPLSTADETTWYEDRVEAKDAYHCASNGCSAYCGDGAPESNYVDCIGKPWVEENTGWTYVSLSGWFNSAGQVVESTHTWDYVEPAFSIASDQLEAVKDLWRETCWPTQQYVPVFPDEGSSSKPHWNQQDHMEGKYSVLSTWEYMDIFNTTGGERDFDFTPFCDWLYGVDVESLTTNDCESIDYITCDDAGNVVEMQLGERALKGDLPDSFTALTKLKKLYLGSNQLTGPLPVEIWTSPVLEVLSISHNFFTGEVSCPTHAEPKLKTVSISNNDFTGPFPSCILSSAPKLQYLYMDYLKLTDAHIPPEIKYATELVLFSAIHAGLTGELPVELMCMKKLTNLRVQRNHLSGEINQEMFDGMTAIYSFDLRDNMFTGPIPHVRSTHTELRNIYLSDNTFSGEMAAQLLEFANSQEQGATASVALGDNSLSGPLPSVYYNLVMNAKRISGLSVAGNHYRCGPDGDWPDWVYRMGSAFFGKCVPVAKPTLAVGGDDAKVEFGEMITIYGENFAPSEELKCKVGAIAVPATFVSSVQIKCMTPSMCVNAYQTNCLEPGTLYTISVANYGEDYSSIGTIAGYVDSTVTTAFVSPSSPPSPPAPAVSIATAAFSASGDVSDYDQATQAGIQTAIASEAGVAVSAVSLDISAGSVIITATIAVPAAQVASSVDALSSGMFSSPSALQAALSSAGVAITVEAIQTAPMTISSPAPPPLPERPLIPPVETGMSKSTRIGAAVGGAIGGVVVIGVAAYVVYLLLSKQMHKKPISVVVKETSVGVTAVSSTAFADIGGASASADVEMAEDEKI